MGACSSCSQPLASAPNSSPRSWLSSPAQRGIPSTASVIIVHSWLAFLTVVIAVLIGLGVEQRLRAEADAERARVAELPQAGPGPDFFRRIPPALGRDLLALEMEDHYLRIHTAIGSDLILLRLRDAMGELGPTRGRQVHRSWWVAEGAVAEAERARCWCCATA